MMAKPLVAFAVMLAVSAGASNSVHARGGHGGFHFRGSSAPTYLVIDIDEVIHADDLENALQKIPNTLIPFAGHVVSDSSSVIPLDGPASARFIVIQFDNVDKAKEWDASNDGKEFEAVRHSATKSREFLAVSGPIEGSVAFGGRNSAARQEMMKTRNEELKGLKNICKGC
jgi:uncharacterized protein (DUF1330 family)